MADHYFPHQFWKGPHFRDLVRVNLEAGPFQYRDYPLLPRPFRWDYFTYKP